MRGRGNLATYLQGIDTFLLRRIGTNVAEQTEAPRKDEAGQYTSLSSSPSLSRHATLHSQILGYALKLGTYFVPIPHITRNGLA